VQGSKARPQKCEHQDDERDPEARTGRQELSNVQSAVRLEVRPLRHPVESEQPNHQWEEDQDDWRPNASGRFVVCEFGHIDLLLVVSGLGLRCFASASSCRILGSVDVFRWLSSSYFTFNSSK